MSSGNITYVVDKLQNKKLLVRRASMEDRRVIYAELTEEGTAFFEQIFPQHHEVIISAEQGLSEDEKEKPFVFSRSSVYQQAVSCQK